MTVVVLLAAVAGSGLAWWLAGQRAAGLPDEVSGR
jgi:hypothetical protein